MRGLWVMTGPAGSGKSGVGRAVAKRLGAVFLDSDTVSEAVVRAAWAELGGSVDDRDSARYKSLFREAVYEALWQTVGENVGHLPVVAVGPFTREVGQVGWREVLERRFAVEVRIHHLWCAPEVRLGRLRARANPRDRKKLENWAAFRGAAEAPVLPEGVCGWDSGAMGWGELAAGIAGG